MNFKLKFIVLVSLLSLFSIVYLRYKTELSSLRYPGSSLRDPDINGFLTINIPNKMIIYEQYDVNVCIRQTLTTLCSDSNNFFPPDDITTKRVMKVTLIGENFNIKSNSSSLSQIITSTDATNWNWTVTPLENGKQDLKVIISLRYLEKNPINVGDFFQDIKIKFFTVDVDSNFVKDIIKLTDQFGKHIIFLLIIILLIAKKRTLINSIRSAYKKLAKYIEKEKIVIYNNARADATTLSEKFINQQTINNTNQQGNFGIGVNQGTVTGNAKVAAILNENPINDVDSVPFKEAIADIKQLLEELAKDSTNDVVLSANLVQQIDQNETLKGKIVRAIKESGLAAFEKVFDTSAGAFIMTFIETLSQQP